MTIPQNRSKQTRSRIFTQAKKRFKTDDIHLFYQDGAWWVRVLDSSRHAGDYDVLETEPQTFKKR